MLGTGSTSSRVNALRETTGTKTKRVPTVKKLGQTAAPTAGAGLWNFTDKTKKTARGSGKAAAAVNPAYAQEAAKWKAQADGLGAAPGAGVKPTYTDSYAERIAQMEKDGTPKYISKFQSQIDGLLDQIANRGAFQYDMSADPLYQQYRAQYMDAGRSAMRDAMGQAAALTGGYGSSYASTAGNQAYQSYLQQLNDKALALQDSAFNRYQAEGSRLQQLLGNYQTEENSAYGRHQDAVEDYYNRLAALRQGQQTEYGRYQDEMSQYNTERDRELNQYNTELERALEQYRYWAKMAEG